MIFVKRHRLLHYSCFTVLGLKLNWNIGLIEEKLFCTFQVSGSASRSIRVLYVSVNNILNPNILNPNILMEFKSKVKSNITQLVDLKNKSKQIHAFYLVFDVI